MKHVIAALLVGWSIVGVRADSHCIRFEATVREGDRVTATPSVVVRPGKKADVTIVKDYLQDANLSLPVGVVVEVIADLKEGKIKYSMLLTIRELRGTAGRARVQAESRFQTRELMLSGIASPGDKIKASVDKETTVTVSFELTGRESPPSASRSTQPMQQTG